MKRVIKQKNTACDLKKVRRSVYRQKYVCMYACKHACIYACMYICTVYKRVDVYIVCPLLDSTLRLLEHIYIYIYIYIFTIRE